MTEEIKPTEEEVKPSFLEEVKAEREALEKVRDELRELKAIDIISGKADAGQQPVKPAEETPEEYAKKALEGNI